MRIVYSTCAVAVMVWLAAAPATAGALARQVERVPQRVQFDGLPWKRDAWLYVPNDYDKTRRYALVVVLHPAGLRGHRDGTSDVCVHRLDGVVEAAGHEA